MIYFQKCNITGVINTTVYADGLESSQENPKRLLSILVQVDAYQGNDVQGWWEREKTFELDDKLIDSPEEGSSNVHSKSFNRVNEIEVGHDLPAGTTFKLALKCGGTANNITAAYRYEITG